MSTLLLEQALLTRLTGDATLTNLATLGVWNTFRPEDYPITVPPAGPRAWVTFTVVDGGDTNSETGPRRYDLFVEVMAHTDGMDSVTHAKDIDQRLQELLVNWTPGLTGHSAWPIQRTDTIEVTAYDEGMIALEWMFGARYRVRYEALA